MIVVDTSVIVAILRREDGWEVLDQLVFESPQVAMSVANLLELHMVATSYRGSVDVPPMLEAYGVTAMAVTVAQLEIAKSAHDRYGRGSGHKAALNYGDCFAYALAKATGQPLLFKGNDLAQTDVEAVPY